MWECIVDLMPAIVTLIVGGFGFFITSSFQKSQKSQKALAIDRLNKDLFSEFNARYDLLNDSLVIIEDYYKDFDSFKILEIENKERYIKLRQDVIDFFNLCAEENYWNQKRRIDPIIWKAWSSGMNYWYNNVPIIKRLWEKEVELAGTTSYYLKGNERFFVPKK